MRPIALTRSVVVAPIAAFLSRIGAPVEALLARSGLSTSILAYPESLIPTVGVVRLLNHAAGSHGIGNVGLLAGLEARVEALGVFGREVRATPTLGDALRAEIRLHGAFSSSGRTWIVLDGDRVKFCQGFTREFDEEWEQASHYILMLMLAVLRLGAGPTWRPQRVELQTRPSSAVRHFELLSDTDVQFARPMTAITFPRALLDAPLPPPRPLAGTSDGGVEAWLASAPAGDFAGSISQVIRTLSWDGYPHIRATAGALGMSVRTLQRYLTSAGTTHEAMVGQARFASAASRLRETDANILDIALDLGYSDHAHFTRAFRRWAGCSPQEFRRATPARSRPDWRDA
jgi:AraC-like DNA-binding protein